MTYSGWLRHNYPTGAVEGDTYKCLSTGEMFCYRQGKWNQVSFKVAAEPAPAKDEKPKTVKRSRKKKAE